MITEIEGTITLDDGRTIEFSIDREYGWSQWGQTEENLWDTVELLDDISETLSLHWSDKVEQVN
jgi:hypothetical protein